MEIIRNMSHFREWLRNSKIVGCLADTGFLYAVADTDDRLYEKAIEAFEALEELNIPVYMNVISRMEFVDLIFRKQITIGSVETFGASDPTATPKALFNLLKSIRDENTAQKRDCQSYKVPEGKLKKLREHLNLAKANGWRVFCRQYAGEKLFNEWEMLEDELGLHFIEILEGQTSEIVEQPLRWSDMVQVMGRHGLRGPDAMTTNLFLKSNLPLLITTDSDIVESLGSETEAPTKAILHLE